MCKKYLQKSKGDRYATGVISIRITIPPSLKRPEESTRQLSLDRGTCRAAPPDNQDAREFKRIKQLRVENWMK